MTDRSDFLFTKPFDELDIVIGNEWEPAYQILLHGLASAFYDWIMTKSYHYNTNTIFKINGLEFGMTKQFRFCVSISKPDDGSNDVRYKLWPNYLHHWPLGSTLIGWVIHGIIGESQMKVTCRL